MTLPVGRQRHPRRQLGIRRGAQRAANSNSAPGAESAAPAQSLSEKLNRSNGVIRPKEVDPAIEKPAPDARDPNVAPAPGTSSGAAAPQPK
jgi:hypothetical protein